MGPERRVEKYLGDRVRASGGMCIKLAPTVAGVPDRLVILPGGSLHLVELKSSTGRLRPIQRVMHERLARIGVEVSVLSSKDGIDQWLDSKSKDRVE